MFCRFNLLFLLSGGGKFNYQGTRRWIEDQLESTGTEYSHSILEHCCNCILLAEMSLLGEVQQVMCIDSIGKGSSLHLHVSKPPKEGSAGHSIAEACF
jgi:hypothetical protein